MFHVIKKPGRALGAELEEITPPSVQLQSHTASHCRDRKDPPFHLPNFLRRSYWEAGLLKHRVEIRVPG